MQTHPTLPYLIHNYTESCTWDNGWNNSTLTCRGLITHAETGEIIARPFRKFFNSNQEQAPVFDLDQSVVVTDKKDGSLLISFPRPDGTLGLATRGSFASDQANWANEFYARTYEGKFQPNPRYTYLFEGIVQWNRIVLDYSDMEDLILLGAVDIHTGRNLHLDEAKQGWMGPTTEIFPHTNLREVLEAPERENAEGFVLWDPDTDERVKVKYESYLALHKLLSNCTPKNIWGILSSGEDPEMAYMAAPDEFLGLVKETVATLNKQHAQIKTVATQSYTGLKGALDKEYGSKQWGRKEFAMKAVKNPHRAFLFRLLDEGSIDDMIWNMIKPSGEEPLRKVD